MPKALKGMKDIIPQDAAMWQRFESASRGIFHTFGYREIRTPILEETALFVKSIGGETDIVTKEMFSFKDRGERDISMRPEGTAPIARAYLEAGFHNTEMFQKLYYIGPMFRAERPQAGRMRQFHQIGAEAIGSSHPALDAEVIALMAKILDGCGIKDYRIRVNSLGCAEDKKRLSKALKDDLSGKKVLLCDDCKTRIKVNPLRVMDCKKDSCRDAVRGAFRAIKLLCEGCVKHFDSVKARLDDIKVSYVTDQYIVRGLDYYTGTVFEVSHPALGAQDALGAGGRYDNLIKDLGGPEISATGFALGMERMLIAAGGGKFGEKPENRLAAYIATIGVEAERRGFEIVNALRVSGVKCDMDYEGKSLKAQMRSADKLGARFVIIIGEDELARDEVTLRDMESKEQVSVKLPDLVKRITGKIC